MVVDLASGAIRGLSVIAILGLGMLAGLPALAGPPAPKLGGCREFPAETRGTATLRRPSTRAPTPTSLDQGPRLAAPRLRVGRLVRHPATAVPRHAAASPDPLHRLRRRERPGPVPDPARRAGRGRRRPPRARAPARQLPALRAVRRARNGARLGAARGAVFDLRSNPLRPTGWTSADAAGLPIAAGPRAPDEVRSGVIRHALRVTVRARRAATSRRPRHFASSDRPDLPPMGLRLRLKASFRCGATAARRS